MNNTQYWNKWKTIVMEKPVAHKSIVHVALTGNYQIWTIILVVYMSSGTNWEKGKCEIDGLGVVASERCLLH